MADLDKVKKQVQGSPPLPPAPSPGPGGDLPAPAPPAKAGEAGGMPPPPKAVGGQEEPSPSIPREPRPAGGIGAVKPLKLPQTGKVTEEAEKAAEEAVEVHGMPPVFIKIDKYSDIIKNLARLKSYAMSLRDALDALADIEKELTTGISIAHKALDDFNTTISMLDSRLLKASAIKELESSDAEEIDSYIKGIYDQMERIRGDLENIK